jgi:hypothetical protein
MNQHATPAEPCTRISPSARGTEVPAVGGARGDQDIAEAEGPRLPPLPASGPAALRRLPPRRAASRPFVSARTWLAVVHI